MLWGWQYLCRPTRWPLWEGCRAGRERKNSVRRGQCFLSGGPVRNNVHAPARTYLSAAKGFWASDSKRKSALGAATGCMPERRHLLGASESQTLRPGRQTKLHICTHQMATVGRMPSRTREEELRQEGSVLPVWRTRPEQCACACEEVLLSCKGLLGLRYKKELCVRSSHRVHDLLWCLSSLAPAVKKQCFGAGSTSADPPDGDCGKDAEQDERERTPSGGVRASCLEDPSGTMRMRLRRGTSLLQSVFGPQIQKGTPR
ncbi:uncharacterized protein LOC133497052 [Syngnathoides biaculeatus]|uniref:uncharacterized protein LOC133497052 n=1 Tax=Syngnathoides biaculeatus TaxID=300417 RepID=UPI002ADDF192|nr:uncharacterized protein LOC133497052 [Syngnathoides biaculeatus]